MHTPLAYSHLAEGISRRKLLQMGLVAGLTVSALPLSRPAPLWGTEAAQPKRGGILRVRGYDPVHFDHHLTSNVKTNTTLSFVHSTLVRYKVGAEIVPGTFMVEPHLAERWKNRMTSPMSSTCAGASNGTTSRRSQRPLAWGVTSSMPCSWCSTTSKTLASRSS